jgi:hypothetical protein
MSELQSQINIENAAGLPAFEELLETAIDLCLRDRSLYEDHLAKLIEEQQTAKVDKVAKKIGPWGAREALEYTIGELRYVSVMKEVDRSSPTMLEANSLVQLKIEALGKAILDEAFISLGADTPEQIDRYHKATTEEEKLDVYGWLIKRVRAICGDAEALGAQTEAPAEAEEAEPEEEPSQEQSDEPEVFMVEDQIDNTNFYHPTHLSPKLIGVYPNTELQPTCLGVSILVSAFFEKLGVRYLHGGVVRTAAMEARTIEAAVITELRKFAKAQGTQVPDWINTKLAEIRKAHQASLNRDNGVHAVVLSEFTKRWAQTDPNFMNNMIISDYGSDQMSQAYAALKELEPSLRGLELSMINRSVLQVYNFFDYARELGKNPQPLEEIEDFILGLEPETAMSEILSTVFEDLLTPKTEMMNQIVEQLEHLFDRAYNADYGEALQIGLQGAILDYVFPDNNDGDISDCIRHCKTDEGYMKRRAEDLSLAKFYGIMRLLNWLQASTVSNTYRQSHSHYEVGLPTYRIGAAVLSDLAAYTVDEIPPSFWLTYWPSHISLAEHIDSEFTSPAQTELQKEIARYINNVDWTYNNIYDIVESILEQEEEGGEEDTGQS